MHHSNRRQMFHGLAWIGSAAGLVLASTLVAAVQQVADMSDRAFAGKNCLTSGCHAGMAATPVVHAPVKAGQCDGCHEAGDEVGHKFELVATGADLCYECHDSDVVELESAKSTHGPVSQGECLSCHDAHGSGHRAVLLEAYDEALYLAPADADRVALCFECHDAELIEDTETEETGFRNGTLNLHHVHFFQRTKGRSCRICHVVHASDQPKLIRDSVPMGDWKMRISFKTTPGGGTCAAACHAAKTYDRESPVNWSAPRGLPGGKR